MSPSTHKAARPAGSPKAIRPQKAASTFAALGDPTRLALLAKLSRGQRQSISQLARDSHLTRQAITKHLRVLERARMVRCAPAGRQRLYALDPAPVLELRAYLDRISAQWDDALARLRTFVESE
ncbi:MAG TPA: metalloregulator ArsR/SmtB family transcription factor [Acidobacteriaceae bacterium]|jgi:DNA-binding transcriptional ArsR family regulator|nr:metalloregulator ArsR/SmtB family transcription factor [Acidobacteriaceae bacterium]